MRLETPQSQLVNSAVSINALPWQKRWQESITRCGGQGTCNQKSEAVQQKRCTCGLAEIQKKEYKGGFMTEEFIVLPQLMTLLEGHNMHVHMQLEPPL